jgi:hypothetical protein
VKRRLLGLVVLLVVAALLADCGGNTEMVATTANCAGLPASEYWSCIEEEATNDHVAVGAPMSEDEEAEMNGTTPP